MTDTSIAPTSPGIIRAMHAVLRAARGVAKDRKNAHHGYFYSGHDDVTEVLHDAFVDAGIVQSVTVLSHHRSEAELVRVQVQVKWTSTEDGTSEAVEAYGESALMKGVIPDLQFGKAVSYAVKYAQMKTFMLIGGADDDPERGHGRPEQKQATPTGVAGNDDPVSDDVVRGFEDDYRAVTDGAGLNKLRQAVSNYLRRFTEAQYERLRLADESAALTVSGGA